MENHDRLSKVNNKLFTLSIMEPDLYTRSWSLVSTARSGTLILAVPKAVRLLFRQPCRVQRS